METLLSDAPRCCVAAWLQGYHSSSYFLHASQQLPWLWKEKAKASSRRFADSGAVLQGLVFNRRTFAGLLFMPCAALLLRYVASQAEGILKKGGGFMGLFGGGSEKYEDAAGVFNRAGMAFKATKKCACRH
jgi:hypothetical protein